MRLSKISIKLIIFLYFIPTSNQIKFQIPEHSEFLKKLVQFIIDREMTNMFQRFGSRVVVVDGSEEAIELFEIMSARIPISTIVTTLNSPYMNRPFDPSIIFFLLKDENELIKAMDYVQKSKLHQSDIPTVFVNLRQVEDEEQFDILSIMKTAWQRGFCRFLLIYGNHKLKALSYNPFTSTIKDVSKSLETDLFPSYYGNLKGYTWKVSLFEEWPLLRKKSTSLKASHKWIGRDILLLKIIASHLNASYKVVEPPASTGYEGVKKDLQNGKADFCFVRRFLDKEFMENFHYVTTGSFSSLSVIVRKSPNIRKPTSILRAFRMAIWIVFIFTMLILLLTTVKFFLKKKPNIFGILSVLLDLWRITLNIPLEATARPKYTITIALVTWMFTSLILNASFQSRMIDLMKYPDEERGIETLEDLERSELPVYSSYDYVEMQGEKGYLRNQMRLVSYQEVLRKLKDQKEDCGIVLPFVNIEGQTNVELLEYLRTQNKTVLSGNLVESYAVYTFPYFSPFISTIYFAVLRQAEYGILNRIPRPWKAWDIMEISQRSKFRLDMKHVSSAFYFIGGGLTLSLAVFIMELFVGRRQAHSN